MKTINLFSEFEGQSKSEWEHKLAADLKGRAMSVLTVKDDIEEISYPSYAHSEDLKNDIPLPGNFPFTRGMNKQNNEWKNGALIEIDDEEKANKKALSALSFGADLLVFKTDLAEVNWERVFKDIQLEIISTQIVISTFSKYQQIKNFALDNSKNISLNIDFLENIWTDEDFAIIANDYKGKQLQFCSVNSFRIQESGGNTWQEVAFCLSTGHEYLLKFFEVGYSIDEATACIGFIIGVGGDYFYETAKIRAFKELWAKIIHAYSPTRTSSYDSKITAVIGLMNKSLKDPHTNLIRQSCEAMSAVNAGIEGLVILPYDYYSTNGETELSSRMALNISSILKEESFFNLVLDPLGGSYSLERLTTIIGQKSWELFQQIDDKGGIFVKDVQFEFTNSVNKKREARIELFKSGDQILIGVNKFLEKDEINNSWKNNRDYLACTSLFLEKELNLVTK